VGSPYRQVYSAYSETMTTILIKIDWQITTDCSKYLRMQGQQVKVKINGLLLRISVSKASIFEIIAEIFKVGQYL
jgi:hypothetical protein